MEKMGPAVPIAPGNSAPDFFARTADGRGVWLQSLRGRKVILHFFPKAAVAAAAEARRYRARADELKGLGVEVIGASDQDADAQGKFAAQNRIAFPLLADEDGTIANSYGATLDDHRGTRGVAFVIDEGGAVEAVFERAEEVFSYFRDRQRKSLEHFPRSSLRSLVSREGVVVQGRYRLKTLVGRGGLGEVWRAEHVHLKRDVALKILTDPPEGDGAQDWIEPCVRRFRFEAQVSALLGARTRHIVSVFDAGYDPVGPYLAMEFVEGRALDQEIAVRGPFSPKDLAPILDQLGDALGAAHKEGIVHRDLKPANVMLQHEPSGGYFVKLTDFGIAKANETASGFDKPKDTAVTQLVGTPEYMSPEQLRGMGTDLRIDVWAFGALVYEALTGVVPFDANTTPELILKIVRSPHEPPSSLVPVPQAVDVWMDRALAKDPAARFGSIAEAVRAYHLAIAAPILNPLASAATVRAFDAPIPLPEPSPRETRSAAPVEAPTSLVPTTSLRKSWLTIAAVAVAGVAITAALWGLRANDPAPSPEATRTIDRPVPASEVAPIATPPSQVDPISPEPEHAAPQVPDSGAVRHGRGAPRTPASGPTATPRAPDARAHAGSPSDPPKPAPRSGRGKDPSATF
jgi:serine/threonine protein kinase/peroxiredoxin